MIAYLIKHWKLFLDIVVVVAGIILFTLFDPFGIFSKTQLKGTANLVSGVKEIGELVTAEYYGEVISSLNETYIFDLPKDTVSEQFVNCYNELLHICLNAVESNTSFRSFFNGATHKTLKNDFKENQIYAHLIGLIGINQLGGNESDYLKDKNKELKENAEKEVLRNIFNQLEAIEKRFRKDPDSPEKNDALNAFSDTPAYVKSSAAFHYQLNNDGITRRERRHDIVFIGRGWVKAGYKFDQLNERNFIYDNQRKIIRIYGLSPQVLDKDINPWFIPERKIKGFELVDFYKGAQFEDALPVKKKCKEKLLEQAQQAGLIEQAQKNGAEALKKLFSLLLNEPGIKVEFYPLPFQNELNLIAADTTITINEALFIDSIFAQANQKITNEPDRSQREFYKQQLLIFYNQLTQLYFIDTGYHFNIFSIDAAKLLTNKHYITRGNYEDYKLQRGTLRRSENENNEPVIQVPFYQKQTLTMSYNELAIGFNAMLNCIDNELKQTFADEQLTIEITANQLSLIKDKAGFNDEFTIETSTKRVNNQPVFNLTRRSETPGYQFSDLAYPVYTLNDHSLSKNNFIDTTQLHANIDKIIRSQVKPTANKTMDALRNNEIDLTLVPFETQRIQKEVQLKPVKQFIDFVNKPFK